MTMDKQTFDLGRLAADADLGWDYEVLVRGRVFPMLAPSAVTAPSTGADYAHRPAPVRLWLWLARFTLGRDPILAERRSVAMHVPEDLRPLVDEWSGTDLIVFCAAYMAAQAAWQRRIYDNVFARLIPDGPGAGPATGAAAVGAPVGAAVGASVGSAVGSGLTALRPGGPLPASLGGGVWGPGARADRGGRDGGQG